MKILPPRFTLRARVTRAASIWRFVTQPGSRALSPKSPNASVDPRSAMPFMRPRWVLRYLTRLGISMTDYPSAATRWAGSTSPLKIHTFTPIAPNVVCASASP